MTEQEQIKEAFEDLLNRYEKRLLKRTDKKSKKLSNLPMKLIKV